MTELELKKLSKRELVIKASAISGGDFSRCRKADVIKYLLNPPIKEYINDKSGVYRVRFNK